MMPAITLKDIKKYYGNKKNRIEALSGVSFEVNKGEIFGLIAPDAAGKTSLLRILITLFLADKGEPTVDGFDLVKIYTEIRKRVENIRDAFHLTPVLPRQ